MRRKDAFLRLLVFSVLSEARPCKGQSAADMEETARASYGSSGPGVGLAHNASTREAARSRGGGGGTEGDKDRGKRQETGEVRERREEGRKSRGKERNQWRFGCVHSC